jgi:hypothetical protein
MTVTDRDSAHELYRAAFAPRPELDAALRQSARRAARAADVLTLVAGLWLICAPYTLSYTETARSLDGYWNDALAGAVIGLAALVRLADPLGAVAVRVGVLALGCWLVAAPFLLGYGGADAPRATANEMVTGVLVALLAVVSLRAGTAARRHS